ERDRERPRLVAEHELLAARRAVDEPPSLAHRRDEHLAVPPSRRRIGRIDQLAALGTEDRDEVVELPALGRVVQRLHRRLRPRIRARGGPFPVRRQRAERERKRERQPSSAARRLPDPITRRHRRPPLPPPRRDPPPPPREPPPPRLPRLWPPR